MLKKLLHMACLLLFVFLPLVAAAQQPVITVSIAPQKFFVEKLAAGLVQINTMVAPGASPATYEPKARQMAKLHASIAYFAIGVPFEKTWLPRMAAQNRTMTIIHCDKGVHKRTMAGQDTDKHRNQSPHQGADPHIWLSPTLVKIQAKTIAEALIHLLPEQSTKISTALHTFLEELEQLDRQIHRILADIPQKRRSFLVFHPSWGYFADNYRLQQIAIETEGKEPGPRELQKLIKTVAARKIRVLFVQSQFSRRSARTLAGQLQAEVITADSLAENWQQNLLSVARKIRAATRENGS